MKQNGSSRGRNLPLRILECLFFIAFVVFMAMCVRQALITGQQRLEAAEMRERIRSSMPAETEAALPEARGAIPSMAKLNMGKAANFNAPAAGLSARQPAPVNRINPDDYGMEQAGMGSFMPLSAPSFQLFGTEGPNGDQYNIIWHKRSILPEMQGVREYGADIVGILKAGEDIDLYVVQGGDNDYYLTHNARGEPSRSGAAFLDARCLLEPRSTHMIIHGHNMRSGAIFGKLDDFRDAQYLKKYPLVHFTSMYEREVYVPYAIADISVDPLSANYVNMPVWDFDTDESFTRFVDALRGYSFYRLPVDVQPGDELLSLVTCSYNYDDGRFVMALRKLRDDETEETMARLIRDSL